MNARKVLEMGGGTLLVSIPKSWARKNRITKGATLAVEELSERKLVVRPIEEAEGQPRMMMVDYPREDLTYVINDVTGAYLLGFDMIQIKGRSAITREDHERLKSAIGRLIGLEIMEEDSKKLTMQFLLDPAALSPEKLTRRMTGIIEGMIDDTKEGIVSRDPKLLALVEARDDEVDRLYFLLVRTIRTATIDPETAERFRLAPVEVLDFRVLASFLESVGDTLGELSKRLSEELPNKETVKRLLKCLELLREMQDLGIRSFLSRRASESHEIHLRVDSLSREVSRISSQVAESPGAGSQATFELVGLMERANKIFVDISDLAVPNYPFG